MDSQTDGKLNRFLFFIVCVAAGFSYVTEAINVRPIIRGDTHVFFEMADQPIFSSAMWCNKRPPIAAILYKACNKNPQYIVIAQKIIWGASWLLFLFAVYAFLRNKYLALLGCITSFLLSLVPDFYGMTDHLLADSLSLSMLISSVALIILVMRFRSLILKLLMILNLLLFTFVRDSQAWMFLTAGICLLLISIFASKKIVLTASALLMIALFTIVHSLENCGSRWKYPFYNVLLQRILPDHDNLIFFEAHGMPLTPILQMSGKWGDSDHWAIYFRQEFEPFRQWALKRGRAVYMKFLMLHPAYLLLKPFADKEEIFRIPQLTIARIVAGLGLVSSVSLLWLCFRKKDLIFAVPSALLFLALAHALVIYHADAMEVGRHSLPVALQVRLSFLLGILLTCDFLLSAKVVLRHAEGSSAVVDERG